MNGISSLEDVIKIEKKGMSPNFPQNTFELIQYGTAINPKAPALSFFLQTENFRTPKVWNYQQLLEQITQTANFFHGLGASKDTVIAFILPNLPETHFVIWGGQATGIVSAINPLLEADAITELLNSVKASIVVSIAPFPGTDLWEKVSQVVPKVPSIQHLVLINIAHHIQGLKKLPAFVLQKKYEFQLSGLKGLKHILPLNIQIHDYHHSIRSYSKKHLNSQRVISPDDYSSFFCTGGTTGIPKIAMRTHRNEISNAWSAAQFFGDGVNSQKTIFCGLPLFHVNAVLVTGLLPFSKGAHVVLGTPQGYRGEGVIKNFWKIVEHYHINFFSGVPTLYSALLEVPVNHTNISSLEFGLCGAAPLPVEIVRSFEKKTGLKMLEGYGLTEGTCVSSVNPPLGQPKIGSIGIRIPNQNMKAVILDEDGQYLRDATDNEIGVLIISGNNVFSGYSLPEQNKNIWIKLGDDQRWLNTGDLGYQDQEGYFYLTGRKKELIIRGGHNIDPQTIEEPLLRHPAVALVAAIGRPDRHAGELPVAYVQLKENTFISSDELMVFAKKHITERAAIPKKIEIIDQIPLTAVGKIYKVALKHKEIKEVLQDVLRKEKVDFSTIDIMEDKTKGIVVRVSLNNLSQKVLVTTSLQYYPYHLDICLGVR